MTWLHRRANRLTKMREALRRALLRDPYVILLERGTQGFDLPDGEIAGQR